MVKNDRKVAVVLSGGGAKGAYEAGALTAIVKKTPEIHIMSGASIGAINAAVFAWQYEKTGDLAKAAAAVRSTWSDLDNLFVFGFWRLLFATIHSYLRTGSPLHFSSLVSNRQIKAKLTELLPPDLKISDLKRIELTINATSLTDGKTVAFTRENDAYLHEAILASSALPLIFEAQLIQNSFYVDGGVFNNTPLRDGLNAGATDVFVVKLKPRTKDLYLKSIRDPVDYRSVYRVGTRMVELIMDKIMYEDLKNAKKVNSLIEVIQALESSGANRRIIADLKESIGYQKGSRFKRYVNFYEIAPARRLEPPGTLGFRNKEAIDEIIALGQRDGEEQLRFVEHTKGWRAS